MNRLIFVSGVLAATIACASTSNARAAQSDDESTVAMMRLVPPSAHAAIIVPNLKRSSGNITRLLEGMDRANILVGSRPIDHFKGLTGYATAVADEGAAALVVLDANASPPDVAWLVPVTDAASFLEANFAAIEGADADVRRGVNGAVVYSRVIGQHVAMGVSREAVNAWTPDTAALPIASIAQPDPFLAASSADVVVVLRKPALAALKTSALERAPGFMPMVPRAALDFVDHIQSMTLAITCDPLALIVRSELRFAYGSAIGSGFTDNVDPPAEINLLPAKSFALAMSVDPKAFGGRDGLQATWTTISPRSPAIPHWIAASDSIAIGVSPGPNAALLSDAAVVVRSATPTAIRNGVKEWLTECKREFLWDESKTIADGTIADALSVRLPDATPEFAAQLAAETLLFGAAGFRGLVQFNDNGVVAALAQRPALLGQFADASEKLNETAAVQIMRQWMPAHRDVEAYIGMAQSSTLISNATAAFNLPATAVPVFDENAPPIGVAVDVNRRGFTSSMIVPAGVLAPIFDEALRRVRAIGGDGEAPQP